MRMHEIIDALVANRRTAAGARRAAEDRGWVSPAFRCILIYFLTALMR